MGILKRATLHIRRRKSRTLVLFLLTVSLSVLCLASIQLKSLADRESRALAESLGSSFILKADTNNMGYYEYRTGDGYSYQVYTGPKVTQEILQTVIGIDGVTDFFSEALTTQWTSLKLYPELLDAVMEEVEERVDLNGLLLEKDDSDYAASVKPYRQVGIFTTVLLTALLLGGAVLLYLIHALWIRSRRRETGIYLSLGISRRQITGQFVLESILVTAAAFAVSCVLAGPVIRGAGTLAEELTAPKEGQQTYALTETMIQDIYIQKVSPERIVLDADLTAAGIGWTAAVVFGVSAGSVLAATRKNTGKDPKQLLDSI